ncbi:Hypothetical protein I595_1386 [Croceitalea dokdonensis DOKDO 023]|uniref:Uncharacterized protein n=1 Tax=Croceitalea dokdonensis DOKDO 023 TaxID=1300341 RepID=A0A0P7AWA4_9FLAO|nr:hypothetical protein [Croceitalea dokdonensis]KPM32959.1 Hypothetical protein I595_1386 [Croceitalea dokdonensis DOKDO 023]
MTKDQPLDRVVLITGDTLYGKVDYFKEGFAWSEFYRKLRLTDTKGRKKRLKLKKVISYSVNGYDYESHTLDLVTKLFAKGRFFDSKYYIDQDGEQHFLKVISKGKLSHYELEWIDRDNNDLESLGLIKKAEHNFFIPAENRLGRVVKKVVSDYLADCPELQRKITDKEMKYVFEVVDFYNKHCE